MIAAIEDLTERVTLLTTERNKSENLNDVYGQRDRSPARVRFQDYNYNQRQNRSGVNGNLPRTMNLGDSRQFVNGPPPYMGLQDQRSGGMRRATIQNEVSQGMQKLR